MPPRESGAAYLVDWRVSRVLSTLGESCREQRRVYDTLTRTYRAGFQPHDCTVRISHELALLLIVSLSGAVAPRPYVRCTAEHVS